MGNWAAHMIRLLMQPLKPKTHSRDTVHTVVHTLRYHSCRLLAMMFPPWKSRVHRLKAAPQVFEFTAACPKPWVWVYCRLLIHTVHHGCNLRTHSAPNLRFGLLSLFVSCCIYSWNKTCSTGRATKLGIIFLQLRMWFCWALFHLCKFKSDCFLILHFMQRTVCVFKSAIMAKPTEPFLHVFQVYCLAWSKKTTDWTHS